MINQIIKDWVEEDIQPFKVSENMEEREIYNQALQDLNSRIPQLTERIERETLDKVIEFINSGHPEPCNDNGWSIDLSDVEDFINTLKGGKK